MDDSMASDHWKAFNNVFQIHCPKIVLSNTTRDVRRDATAI